MTRISLRETYDNRDVIAQICDIRDTADAASATATAAQSSAGAAATAASQSAATATAAQSSAGAAATAASQSAATVAGYDNRLQTAEGKITALETADQQNVKLTGNQAISGVKTVPTENTGSATQQIANSAKVKNELDAYAPMVRLSGNQAITDVKTVPTEATGTRSSQVANSNKIGNELDSYAPMVRTSNNQDIGGSKRFLSPTNAMIGFAVKLSNAYAFVCDTNDLPSTTSVLTFLVCERGGIQIIEARITTDETGTPYQIIANGTNLYGSPVQMTVGAVKVDTRMNVYVGSTGTNRYLNIIVLGSFGGSGNVNVPTIKGEFISSLPEGAVVESVVVS